MQNANKIVSENPSVVWVNESYIEIDRVDSTYYKTNIMDLVTRIEGDFKVDYAENLFKVITDGDHGKRYYVSKGVPFYTAVNVQEEGFNDKTNLYITEDYEESLKRSRLTPNSLLIVKTGVGTGISCVIGAKNSKGNISADVGIFKEPSNTIDPHFISTFMNSKSGRDYILRSSYGSTRNRLTIAELKRLKLPIVSKKIQKYIGDKVRKSEQLREEARMMENKLNDEITKVLGKVPYELFAENKWGIPSTGNLTERLDPNYYREFYLKIEELLKEKGNFTFLSNICDVISQGFNKSTFTNDGSLSAIGVGDFGYISPISNEDKSVGCSEKQKLKIFDIVWCNTAHLSKYIGEKINIILEADKFAPTAEVTFVRPNVEKVNPYFLYAFFNTDWGYYQIQRTIRGMVPRSYAEDVKNIVIPIINLNEEQEEIFKNGVEKVFKYNLKSKRLIAEAKNDIESLIDGTFNDLKITEGE